VPTCKWIKRKLIKTSPKQKQRTSCDGRCLRTGNEAKAQEARAKVIEAEAEVPKAMAEAFRIEIWESWIIINEKYRSNTTMRKISRNRTVVF
jgi:uncharacterized protein YqfA (UPF0365 family)